MNLTPDGARYAAMGVGQRVPRPFHFRWLIPRLCRDKPVRWRVCGWLSAGGAFVGVWLLTGAGWRVGLAAALLWAGLPSVRFALRFPVLVDLPTVAVSTLTAVLYLHNPVLGICAAVVAGTVNERAPIFAALFAWSPLPLVGLVAPLVRMAQRAGPDPLPDQAWILEHPVRASLQFHAGKWRDPLVMVLPWGACLVALGGLDAQVVAVLAVAYAQLLIATDSVRLYQQAAPIVCIAAVMVVPLWAVPVLLVVTWFNPLAGNGV